MSSLPPHALRVTVLLLAVVAALLGMYLLAWAWRWPHSDVRDSWASLTGTCAVLAAAGVAVVTVRSGRSAVLVIAAALSLAVIAVGLFAVATVADGQREACGPLPACDSLLPGL